MELLKGDWECIKQALALELARQEQVQSAAPLRQEQVQSAAPLRHLMGATLRKSVLYCLSGAIAATLGAVVVYDTSAAASLFALTGWSGLVERNSPAQKSAPVANVAAVGVTLAAPGRVEGRSELINLGPGMDGVLSAVLVEEGEQVGAGHVVATVDCRDLEMEIQTATESVEISLQARARLLRGSREEQRREAAAQTARAHALLKGAELRYQRMARLIHSGSVAKGAFDNANSEFGAAKASLRFAAERERLVNAPPLPEEIARADAEVRAAEARLKTVRARFDKCAIRTPLAGTILRRYMRAGETVSTINPQPIVGIMDTSRLRVRAEVDERDLGRIGSGQRALILADAFPEIRFPGHLTTVGSLMGRKKVRTGDPAEKGDRDVLEVLIDLDEQDPRLVIGLRVTVQFIDDRNRAPLRPRTS